MSHRLTNCAVCLIQVKVWCTRQEASVINIDMKANICCVKYNPGSSNYIAVYTSTPQLCISHLFATTHDQHDTITRL